MKKFIVLLMVFLRTIAFADTNANTPVQAVHIMMDSMKNYIQAPKSGKLNPSDISNNIKIDRDIRAVFNYPHLIKGSLAPYWEKLSKKQKEDLMTKLSRVIELTAYPRGGYYFKTASVTIGEANISNDIASVPVDFTLKGTTLKSVFKLRNDGDGYKVIDYVLDEKSLIALYKDQFSRIIRKKGLSYFLKKVIRRYNLLTKMYSK